MSNERHPNEGSIELKAEGPVGPGGPVEEPAGPVEETVAQQSVEEEPVEVDRAETDNVGVHGERERGEQTGLKGRLKLANISQRKILIPPLNFAPVEKQLYRSGEPHAMNFEFLSLLRLKTIVWLAVEDPNEAFLNFADDNDITFEHLGILTEGANPWDDMKEEVICQALELILNRASYPVLVSCSMGRHRTGTVIGCLRKLQDWSFASLIDEYQRFAGPKGERASVEMTIEAFDPTAVKIPSPPRWWERQMANAANA